MTTFPKIVLYLIRQQTATTKMFANWLLFKKTQPEDLVPANIPILMFASEQTGLLLAHAPPCVIGLVAVIKDSST